MEINTITRTATQPTFQVRFDSKESFALGLDNRAHVFELSVDVTQMGYLFRKVMATQKRVSRYLRGALVLKEL